jgi:nicotinate phosphoribosyltransferase
VAEETFCFLRPLSEFRRGIPEVLYNNKYQGKEMHMTQGLLWQKDAPIIRRVDENDVYKIMMMYLIWSEYPNLRVKFGFKNRTTSVSLADFVDMGELREHIEAASRLTYTDEVLAIYRSWEIFPEDFLQALKQHRLTMPHFEIRSDKTLHVEADGLWFDETPWEIYILAIVSELAGRGRAKAAGLTEEQLFKMGDERLLEKIAFFKKHPEFLISQFGLRRRFSGPWEEHVTARLLEETDVITGVSNMYLADCFGVPAQGTNAHELPMALTALARHSGPKAMREAPYLVLSLWQKLFGHKSLIMLDDAYGSEVFRCEVPRHFLESYRGFRHDSGDPFAYGDAVLQLYQQYGIDSRTKVIIFSDGLTPETVLKLYEHFKGRIIVLFGMGTNLTNDFGVLPALSLVMKITEAAGNPAVKLSNNLNKATGLPEEVEYYKGIFGYTNTASEAVVY